MEAASALNIERLQLQHLSRMMNCAVFTIQSLPVLVFLIDMGDEHIQSPIHNQLLPGANQVHFFQ